MAGKTPRVLVTPTPDLGRVLNSMQGLEIEGEANLSSAVQIAQLALKHRQNKNQRQRIVLFVGSPIREDKARAPILACILINHLLMQGRHLLVPGSICVCGCSEVCENHMCGIPAILEQALRAHLTWGALHQDKLVRIAKKLKKNNVAVDVVAFGSEGEDANAEKLEAFREAVNSGDNSHLVTVPAGTVLSDMLFSSPIFQVAHATLLCSCELRGRGTCCTLVGAGHPQEAVTLR